MTISERALGEAVEDTTEPEIVDVTQPVPAPENFDIDDWIAGVRATRRAVKLRPNGHLVARLEQIADQIQNTPDDENVDDLVDEFDRVKAQINDGIWFTVEKRSSEWLKQFRRDTSKRLNLKLGEGQPDEIKMSLHQMVQQIVEPAGVTYAHLTAMLDQNEGELNKLMLTVAAANATVADAAGVMDLDFSDRRSSTDLDSSES